MTTEQYIAGFAPPVQAKLNEMRALIKEMCPDATEKISYGIPAFFYEKPVVYFAAFSKHIGLYPTSSGIMAFSAELSEYKHSKGTVRFPMDKPLPVGLIKRIVAFRRAEVLDSGPQAGA